jgi:hypothetical protein
MMSESIFAMLNITFEGFRSKQKNRRVMPLEHPPYLHLELPGL